MPSLNHRGFCASFAGLVRCCTTVGSRYVRWCMWSGLRTARARTLKPLARLMLWVADVREGTRLMLDLWIVVLTLGLFGVAAGFVRVLERL